MHFLWPLLSADTQRSRLLGAEEMAQCLKALAAFPEDLNSDSGINIVGSQAPVVPAQRDLTLSFVYLCARAHKHRYKILGYWSHYSSLGLILKGVRL